MHASVRTERQLSEMAHVKRATVTDSLTDAHFLSMGV